MLTNELLTWEADDEGAFVINNYFDHPVKIKILI